MINYVIHGGKPLHGKVHVSGAKNAAVGILPATLLVKGVCQIENVPDISDIRLLQQILEYMGATVRRLKNGLLEIDCTHAQDVMAPDELVKQIRASYYFIGAQLARFGHVTIALPGGCHFATRPIDQHEKGFQAMGTSVAYMTDKVQDMTWFSGTTGPEGLVGSRVNLDVVSVGATMNIMIGAVLAKGTTYIENAAKEPHVVDLANFLNAMGADVSGAGTDIVRIRGVKELHGGFYSIIPDQIEAGTYMAAAAAVGGDVFVQNVIPKHMDTITSKLREMGVKITEYEDAIHVCSNQRLRRATVKTMPYPGFPTDMQPLTSVCMTLAKGTSRVIESIYDTRFQYCAELQKMGADIQFQYSSETERMRAEISDDQIPKSAIINGVEKLHGCKVKACDLRAGAAMVVAGLAADGTTIVSEAQHIERGYENMIEKFRGLGADITRVTVPDPQ